MISLASAVLMPPSRAVATEGPCFTLCSCSSSAEAEEAHASLLRGGDISTEAGVYVHFKCCSQQERETWARPVPPEPFSPLNLCGVHS